MTSPGSCCRGSPALLLLHLLLAASARSARCEHQAAIPAEEAAVLATEGQIAEEAESMDVRLLQTGLQVRMPVNAYEPLGLDFEAAFAFGDALSVPVPPFWTRTSQAAKRDRHRPSNASAEASDRNLTSPYWWPTPMSREYTSCKGGIQNLVQNCGEQMAGILVVSTVVMVAAYLFLWLFGSRCRPPEASQTGGRAPPQEVASRRGWGPADAAEAAAWQRNAAAGGVDVLAHPMPVLLLVQLAHWTCFGTLAVSVSDMVLQDRCLSLGLVGAACAASGTAQAAAASSMAWLSLFLSLPVLLSMPLLGHLSDVVGRKPVLMLATLQGITFYSVLSLRGAYDTATLSALAALSCLGNVFVADAAACAAVSDLCAGLDEVARVRLFGFAQVPVWLGQLLGPALGMLMGALVGPQRSFLVPAILCGALFALIVTAVPETLPSKGRLAFDWRKAQPFSALRAVRHHQRSAVVAVGLVFAELSVAMGLATWPRFLRVRFDWSDATLGALRAFFCLGNVFVLAFLLPRAATVSGPRRILVTAAILSVVLWILHTVAITPWQMFVIMPVGAFTGSMQPPIRAILTHDLGPRSYGLAMSVALFGQQVAHLIAAPAAQTIWRWVEVSEQPIGAAYFLSVMSSIAAVVIFCMLPPKAHAEVLRPGLEAESFARS